MMIMDLINKLLPQNNGKIKFVSKAGTFGEQNLSFLFWLGFFSNANYGSLYLCITHCMMIMDLSNKLLLQNKVLIKFVSKGGTLVTKILSELFWLGFLPNA